MARKTVHCRAHLKSRKVLQPPRCFACQLLAHFSQQNIMVMSTGQVLCYMTVAAAAAGKLFSDAPFSICCVACAACGGAEGTGTSSYSINDRLFCTWCSANKAQLCVWTNNLTTRLAEDKLAVGHPSFPGDPMLTSLCQQSISS